MTSQGHSGDREALARDSAPARLKKRAEFLAAGKGRRVHNDVFTLQANERRGQPWFEGARVGLTVTKKTGNSVERNRIRRRLREALRLEDALPAQATYDYVIVARRELLSRKFSQMRADLISAFQKIHAARPTRAARNP